MMFRAEVGNGGPGAFLQPKMEELGQGAGSTTTSTPILRRFGPL